MKTHLLPAGYEFQKVQDDYERLMSGRELFHRGALKALAECGDNNACHDLLERFRDYVLPITMIPKGYIRKSRISLSPPSRRHG